MSLENSREVELDRIKNSKEYKNLMKKLTPIAIKNTKYNEEGLAVLEKDSPWREEEDYILGVKYLFLGDVIKSNYTGATYILSCLPNIIDNKDKYALIRQDGSGYCYLRDSLKEVQQQIYLSGEEHFLIKDNVMIEIEGI